MVDATEQTRAHSDKGATPAWCWDVRQAASSVSICDEFMQGRWVTRRVRKKLTYRVRSSIYTCNARSLTSISTRGCCQLQVGAAPTCPKGSPSAFGRGGVASSTKNTSLTRARRAHQRHLTRGCCLWVPLPRARRAHRRHGGGRRTLTAPVAASQGLRYDHRDDDFVPRGGVATTSLGGCRSHVPEGLTVGILTRRCCSSQEGVLHAVLTCGRISRPMIRPQG